MPALALSIVACLLAAHQVPPDIAPRGSWVLGVRPKDGVDNRFRLDILGSSPFKPGPCSTIGDGLGPDMPHFHHHSHAPPFPGAAGKRPDATFRVLLVRAKRPLQHNNDGPTLFIFVCLGPGWWMPRSDFSGRKSFARYQCACGHEWMSAQGFPEGKKGCLGCGKLAARPCCLWHNSRDSSMV